MFSKGEVVFIEDARSSNGTYVNGELIRRVTPLHIGDRIQLGNTVLVFAHHDELEARMQQLQRVEALTAVAAGIAHDFRNFLQVIAVGIEEVAEHLEGAADVQSTIAAMRQAAGGAITLATRLANIRGNDAVDVESVHVRGLVEQAVAMGRSLVGPAITIDVRIDADVALRGSRDDLLRVLVNLITNSRDAMPQGGAITILVREVYLEKAVALSYHLSSKGKFVELRVSDTGIGMGAATRARAFEPFFTTKAAGHGTGLGLAMVHAIIKRHGGSVVIDSAVGPGTTFRFWLPKDE